MLSTGQFEHGAVEDDSSCLLISPLLLRKVAAGQGMQSKQHLCCPFCSFMCPAGQSGEHLDGGAWVEEEHRNTLAQTIDHLLLTG